MTFEAITPWVIAAVTILSGWLLWRSQEGEKDRRDIRSSLETQRADLADFKERVAREHVTFSAMENVEKRVVSAIERIGDRIDRILEGRKT